MAAAGAQQQGLSQLPRLSASIARQHCAAFGVQSIRQAAAGVALDRLTVEPWLTWQGERPLSLVGAPSIC